jgi:hypothetical protein
VDRDPLDAYLHAELPVGVGGVEALRPRGEVEVTAPVGKPPTVQQALPDLWLGEDDQEQLGVVLDYLELVQAQTELAEEGVAEVTRLGVVAVSVEPADNSPVDKVIAAALDGAGCRHSTVAACWPSTRVSWIPRRHGLSPMNHLCVGAEVSLKWWWWWCVELVGEHLSPLWGLGFMVVG